MRPWQAASTSCLRKAVWHRPTRTTHTPGGPAAAQALPSRSPARGCNCKACTWLSTAGKWGGRPSPWPLREGGLRRATTHAVVLPGPRDGSLVLPCREPAFTTKTATFAGTLDYLWVSRSLAVVDVLPLPYEDGGAWKDPLAEFPSFMAAPNAQHPSDHLPICCTVSLV